MTAFVVEVSIPAMSASAWIDREIRTSGSHFVTHAAWWHRGDISVATLAIEAADEAEARHVVPPGMWSAAVRIFRQADLAA